MPNCEAPGPRCLSVAFVDGEDALYIGSRIRMPFRLALRENEGTRLASGALLIFDNDGALRYGARISGRKRVDGLRSSFSFDEVTETKADVSVSRVRAALLKSQQGPTSPPGGKLTERATERVMDMLQGCDPYLADAIASWRSVGQVKPEGSAPTIFEQRDATVMLFRMAGLRNRVTDPEDLAWQIKEMQQTYLGEVPLEDPAVVADACSFLGWKREVGDAWGANSFSDGAGTILTIVNINRQPTESVTGADLVYYHAQRQSFVHVQYKRMKRISRSAGTTWVYDADRQFHGQLTALLELNKLIKRNKESADYRLSVESGYFKFTMMSDYGPGDAALVPGQYMSAEMLGEAIRARGGRLGRLDVNDHCLPYLTNTLFADLVGYGLIGSRGVSHQEMRKLISRLARSKESVVLGVHSEAVHVRRGREKDASVTDDFSILRELLDQGGGGESGEGRQDGQLTLFE